MPLRLLQRHDGVCVAVDKQETAELPGVTSRAGEISVSVLSKSASVALLVPCGKASR